MAVKIAFWSTKSAVGTAENMLLTAWFCVGKGLRESVLVQQESVWRCISSGSGEKILFADCGNARDQKTLNSLKNADIIVVNLRPEREELDAFFQENRCISEKVIYLIGNDGGETQEMFAYIEHMYRIPANRIGRILHNEELGEAFRRGVPERFVIQKNHNYMTEQNRRFFREMERNWLILWKRLEQQLQDKNGGINLWNR